MNSMTILETPLPDVYLLGLPTHFDKRGKFVKTYNEHLFESLGVEFTIAETFYSWSTKHVLRGMHYQRGHAAHSKIVHCLYGSVLDVVVGIDPSKDTFNQCFSVELDASNSQALLIGQGYAHGFLSLSNDALVGYMTSAIHDPQLDTGVLWSSIAFDWPNNSPIISERDECHPCIEALV